MDYIGAHIENSDLIIANANATIDAIRNIDSEGIGNYQTAVVKLGSDIRAKKTQLSISSDVKAAVESGKYILMVGTIEPRKNHKFVLDAFEKELFDKDLHLIFAGRPGWNIEEFMERIQNHPLRNNKFFYFNNATDDDVTYLYENAFVTAFASYNEGFGLPIIESFAHGTPVLSADIPVLRETGGEYCEYFSLNDLDDFVSKVRKYDNEDLYKKICNQIAGYKATTWEECAKEIFSAVSQGI
jgi:glycosyltransferase involved in cell wall biosynthesis